MRDTIQSLESRQMLSAVAAHVIGSTLKITGTPHNDAIVVSLKGSTLTVKANNATSKLPAKGVKLIDVRGAGGLDKLQVTAPIAYRLNGGKIKTPVAAGQTPTAGTTQTSSGTLTIGRPSTGTTDTPISGPIVVNTPAPDSCVLEGSGTVSLGSNLKLGAGTLRLSDPPTSGTLNIVSPVILTGTLFKVGITQTGLGGNTQISDGCITVNEWAGPQPPATTAVFTPITGGSAYTLGNLNPIVLSCINTIAGNTTQESASMVLDTGSVGSLLWNATTFTGFHNFQIDNPGIIAINGGTLAFGTSAFRTIPGGSLSLNSGTLSFGTPTLHLSGSGTLVIASSASFPTPPIVEFATLPSPDQAPQLILNIGESVYLDHPLAFTVTLAPTATIAPGTYPIIRFADGAYMPEDISGMQFKSDTLPAQYTYTLALNAANRTIDLTIADKPAIDPVAVDQPA